MVATAKENRYVKTGAIIGLVIGGYFLWKWVYDYPDPKYSRRD